MLRILRSGSSRFLIILCGIVLTLGITLIPNASVKAFVTLSCSGNDLGIGTNYPNGFGSYRVNGSGPNLPQTVNNGGGASLPGPGQWSGLYVEQWNGVSYSHVEDIGNYLCPATNPPDTFIVSHPNLSTLS